MWRQTHWLTRVTEHTTSRERPCPTRIWYRVTGGYLPPFTLYKCARSPMAMVGEVDPKTELSSKLSKKIYPNTRDLWNSSAGRVLASYAQSPGFKSQNLLKQLWWHIQHKVQGLSYLWEAVPKQQKLLSSRYHRIFKFFQCLMGHNSYTIQTTAALTIKLWAISPWRQA